MMKFTRKLYPFALLTLIALLMAFGSAGTSQDSGGTGNNGGESPVTEEPGGKTASQPSWLTEGCETFWHDKAEDRLCAVGSAAGTYNMTTLRLSAERRARSKIADVLKPEVKALIEKYANSGDGHKDFGDPPDMERVRDLSEMLTQHAVLESQIISIWTPANNRMQLLVALDVTAFQKTVRKMPQLPDKLREELLKRAEKGFKLIEKMEEKS